jgi:hypothetical protein
MGVKPGLTQGLKMNTHKVNTFKKMKSVPYGMLLGYMNKQSNWEIFQYDCVLPKHYCPFIRRSSPLNARISGIFPRGLCVCIQQIIFRIIIASGCS